MPSFGWMPEAKSVKDYLFAARNPDLLEARLPPSIHLRDGFPYQPGDKGSLGSCVACGVDANVTFIQKKLGLPVNDPSELYEYYNGRRLMGTTWYDSGLYIRTGMDAAANDGTAREALWPYNVSRYREQPSPEAYDDGAKNQVLKRSLLGVNLLEIKAALAANLIVTFGMPVYRGYLNPGPTGIIVSPAFNESAVGQHCNDLCGYDDATGMFDSRNSWGTFWGDDGYCKIPYQYILNLASDLWTIETVEGVAPIPPPPPPPVPGPTYAEGYAAAKAKAVTAVQGI